MAELADRELSDKLYDLSKWPFEKDGGYTLGFLIRKLPGNSRVYLTGRDIASRRYGTMKRGFWGASTFVWDGNDIIEKYITRSDSPEDACIELCILLFKAGILKREDKD